MNDHDTIEENSLSDISGSADLEALYAVKLKYMGKKGIISELNKNLKNVSTEEKPILGAAIGKLRDVFLKAYDERENTLKTLDINSKLIAGRLDITLEGVKMPQGSLHLINRTTEEIVNIFATLGYNVATGPEIEMDFFNFEALNMPPLHPARDMQDTFYISENQVLRTHTSPVQIRTMLNDAPPIRIIAPGKVYRADYDATHSPMFHQVEGLYIDKNVNLGHLKGTLEYFVHGVFGSDVPVRFRASYFPFTEPSMEVDMGCTICKGAGCRTCKQTGWLEIGGCGMVAPEVFTHVNLDYDKYSGFAFGMGVERIAMLKYGIDDLRLFYENRLKFVEQF